MTSPAEPTATEVGAGRGDRWKRALWWGGLVLVAAVVMSRVLENAAVILVLGLVATAAIFLVALRTRPAIVTRDEVRLPRRTIHRDGVTRITRSLESTAFVFRDAQDRVVGLADLFERSGEFRDALRDHGWPEVEPPA